MKSSLLSILNNDASSNEAIIEMFQQKVKEDPEVVRTWCHNFQQEAGEVLEAILLKQDPDLSFKLVKLLVDSGANPNIQLRLDSSNSPVRATDLVFLSEKNEVLLQYLVERGADYEHLCLGNVNPFYQTYLDKKDEWKSSSTNSRLPDGGAGFDFFKGNNDGSGLRERVLPTVPHDPLAHA